MLSLDNGSGLPTASLARLAAKVFARSNLAAIFSTHVMVSSGGTERMNGIAYQQDHLSYPIPNNRKFMIYITAGEEMEYPAESLYRQRVGPLLFRSWEDEFVAVLAHEVCHVLQWLQVDGFGEHPHYEVEAEQYAKNLLTRLRNDTRAIHF